MMNLLADATAKSPMPWGFNWGLPAFFAILIACIIFFLIGLLIAWLIWKNSRAEAEEIERDNRELQAEYDALKAEERELLDAA